MSTPVPVRPSPGTWPETTSQAARPPHKKRLSRKAIDNIIDHKLDQMIAECGHVTYPSAVAALVDKNRKHVWCSTCHAWQWVSRRATAREVYNDALGLPLDFHEELPDKPPF